MEFTSDAVPMTVTDSSVDGVDVSGLCCDVADVHTSYNAAVCSNFPPK
jgi:hypothetical protein